MKKIDYVFPGILVLLVVFVLVTGCYRPAAPDVTMDPSGVIESSPLGTPDLEATAIANATEAAQTVAAQRPEGEEPAVDSETPATEPPPPAPVVPAPATETPEPEPSDPEEVEPPPPPSEPTTHVVQLNDTLFNIAQRYGTTVEAIASANGIVNPEAISVGQRLVIPGAGAPAPSPGETTYVVQPGDTLFSIATRYNVSPERLADYNGIVDASLIQVGQVIRIPQQ